MEVMRGGRIRIYVEDTVTVTGDGAGLVRVMGMGKDYKRNTNFKILRRETNEEKFYQNFSLGCTHPRLSLVYGVVFYRCLVECRK